MNDLAHHRRVSAASRVALSMLLAFGVASCDPRVSRPLLVLVGDSTTAGFATASGYRLADEPPLVSLVRMLPVESRWRDVEIVALGVPGSTTREWAVAYPECPTERPPPADLPAWARLAVRACEAGAPLVDHVGAVVGRPVDAVLVVLGTNDPYRHADASVDEAVRNLRTIVDRLAPARVLVASPFWTPDPTRHDFVEALAVRLVATGLLSGPDFARQRLPLASDGIHPTRGAFVAAAGLWLDVLERSVAGLTPVSPRGIQP